MRGPSWRGSSGPAGAEGAGSLPGAPSHRHHHGPSGQLASTAGADRLRCPGHAGRDSGDDICHYLHADPEPAGSMGAEEAGRWGKRSGGGGGPGGPRDCVAAPRRTGGPHRHGAAPPGGGPRTGRWYHSRLEVPAAFADLPGVERQLGSLKRKRVETRAAAAPGCHQAYEEYLRHPAEYMHAYPNGYSATEGPHPQPHHQPPPAASLPYFRRGLQLDEVMQADPYQMSSFMRPVLEQPMAAPSPSSCQAPSPSDNHYAHLSQGVAPPLASLFGSRARSNEPAGPSEPPVIPNWFHSRSQFASLEVQAREQEILQLEQTHRQRSDEDEMMALLDEELDMRLGEAAMQEYHVQSQAMRRSVAYRRPRPMHHLHHMLEAGSNMHRVHEIAMRSRRDASASMRLHLQGRSQGSGPSHLDPATLDPERALQDLVGIRLPYPPLLLRRELQMHALQQMRGGRSLPAHLLLSDRDFDEHDYEALLALDETIENRKGAAKELIDSLPTEVFNAGLASLSEAPAEEPPYGQGRCTVCLEDPVDGEVMRVLPCSHKFHRDCIDQWLAVKASCPICLYDLKADSPNQAETTNAQEEAE